MHPLDCKHHASCVPMHPVYPCILCTHASMHPVYPCILWPVRRSETLGLGVKLIEASIGRALDIVERINARTPLRVLPGQVCSAHLGV